MGRAILGVVALLVAGCFLADSFAESRLESYKPVVRVKAQSRTIQQVSNPFTKNLSSGDDDKGLVDFFRIDSFSGKFLPSHSILKIEIISGRGSLSFRYLSLPPPTAV
ncbi:hypothetical protein LFX25_18610 [Leptospira sp. FAT2]|uniref:hypothetical protein n=1 Tax=Leptospira sanjuanensis TaxID=2879643 RepID=UPI001EE7D537|nr:hypothetical protein [Leptospira sanjuanensis]MCG6169921.1 hypothetical protein [Leptospira sanjuanensis]MCG6195255.1 hypothetical protein [Leptospira sanjuanensis]